MMAVLPTPGSPSRIGLFFVRRERIWMIRSTSFSRPISGSKDPRHRELRQVAAVLGEERKLLLLLGDLPLLDQRDRLLAHAVEVEPARGQEASRDAAVHAEEADEQMLGPDVRVHHGFRLVRGVGEDLLGFLREGQLGGRGDPLDEDAVPLDLAADLLRLDVEAGEDLLDDVLPLAEDAEQEVLGLDHLGAELGGLIAGEEEGPPRFLVVFLKHRQALRVRSIARSHIPPEEPGAGEIPSRDIK